MTAAVLVTHNSEEFIGSVLDSVLDQDRVPDLVVVVDDHSTDGTRAAIERAVERQRELAAVVPSLRVIASTSTASDQSTRIAANFVQGVRACEAHEIVVLGDHDDRWHRSRVAHQERLMLADSKLAMLASDGALVDVDGTALGGSLRDAFPVPENFAMLAISEQIDFVLGHSIATGGASAIRPVLLGEFLEVPPGWLHDRWWSIAATAIDAMGIDRDEVIDYRVHPGQQLGLNRGSQGAGTPQRMASKLSPATVRRLRDVHRLGRRLTGEARTALTWAAIARSALR